MHNTQNVAIVLLTISAVILGIVALVATDEPAYATTGASGGDYSAVTGSFPNNDIDLLYLVDIPNHQLNIYVPNLHGKSIDLHSKIDLARAFR